MRHTMNKYIKFDVIQYIREEKDRQRLREELQQQYDNVSLLPGGTPTGTRGKGISSPTSDAAIKRLAIKAKIDEIDRQGRAFELAWQELTEPQKYVLSEFFYSGNSKSTTVDNLVVKYKTTPREIYRMREEAIGRLSAQILKRI